MGLAFDWLMAAGDWFDCVLSPHALSAKASTVKLIPARCFNVMIILDLLRLVLQLYFTQPVRDQGHPRKV